MCITLDLHKEEGKELFKRLIAESDVLVENFRPGVLEKWGLGWDVLSAVNPRLIMARVSGYGQTGPYASRAGFASVGEAMGGLRYINGYPGEAPPRTGISLGDSLAAMFAVQGILTALYWRDVRGGRGQVIDASIMESCFALLESAVPEYDRLGVIREPSGTGLAKVVPSNIYKSGDGKWMVIAANADNIFRRLCSAMGRLILHLAEQAATAGADEILLADTIGVAVPTQVARLVRGVRGVAGSLPVGVHLHNTRNTGYANAWAALESGAEILDGSVGGIGGCPFAPRATGNIATEDLIYMLHRMGVETGVDLEALMGVSLWLEEEFGRPLPGHLTKAGLFPARSGS